MTNLKYKTKLNSSPQGKQKVYFCCHPDEFERYFEVVSDEILAKQNCAIWYTDKNGNRDEDFLEDLKQMQLFVMPVTNKLLCTENEALDTEFKFAIETHIPVLPLMQENGLEELFNQKCGDLQFLNKHNTDVTSISYDEKLQKFLESVLIGDELADKIRSAFDAYVFLSYRKKDRKYAQELMRLIHKNDFCRDIAIWYDEFLTPGENFNDSIKEALQKSGLFVLTVTPNIVNEPNYIMTTEYPMARSEGKLILPAELVPTNREQLYEQYEGIPDPADAHNEVELSEALIESIKKMAINENDNSPEHDFLIGLAYLRGIDVEVDYEYAVKMITSAADMGLIEATEQLYNIYNNGLGVNIDYQKLIELAQHLVMYYTKKYGEEHEKTLESMYKLACAFQKDKEYHKATIFFEKVYAIGYRTLCEEHPLIYNSIHKLASIYDEIRECSKKAEAEERKYMLERKIFGGENLYDINKLVDSYIKLDNISKASQWFKCAYELTFKKEYENSEGFLFALINMAYYANELGEHHKALKLFERVLSQIQEGEKLSLYVQEGVALTYDDLGDYHKALSLYKKINEEWCNNYGGEDRYILMYMAHTCFRMGDYHKAMHFAEKAYTLAKKEIGEEANATLFLLNDLALIYGAAGDYHKCLELKKRVYELSCKKLDVECFGITASQSDIILKYNEIGDFCKEFELQEKSNQKIGRILDIDHPYFLISLNNMEYPYSESDGGIKELIAAKSLYELRCEILGKNHTSTLISLSNLAFYYKNSGDYEVALSFYEKLCAYEIDVYGAGHPLTLKNLERMKEVRSKIQNNN